MKSYLDIVQKILFEGQLKKNRTGISALTITNVFWEHNMSDGFPLLTTRKMPIKSTAVELEGFLNGITSKKWFQDRSCRYWDFWANPVKVQEEIDRMQNNGYWKHNSVESEFGKSIQKEEDDLGPLGYSWQWRKFGQHYNENDSWKEDYSVNEGFDQLKFIVEILKTNPDDRRLLCSGWNPNQQHMMALPPCHVMWNLAHVNGTLNLHYHQRSCDFLCNQTISTYALLLLLLCKESGLKPGKLSALFMDCHIYENHIEGAKLQLTREPLPLPKVYISSEGDFDIFKWTHKDFVIKDYHHYDPIKYVVAV